MMLRLSNESHTIALDVPGTGSFYMEISALHDQHSTGPNISSSSSFPSQAF